MSEGMSGCHKLGLHLLIEKETEASKGVSFVLLENCS